MAKKKAPTQPDSDDDDILGTAHTSDGKPRPNDGPVSPESDETYRVTANELRQFIERFERLEQEKQDIAAGQKEVMSEAKARGYDTKVMRKIIAERKRDKDSVAEENAVLEMYREALGMA